MQHAEIDSAKTASTSEPLRFLAFNISSTLTLLLNPFLASFTQDHDLMSETLSKAVLYLTEHRLCFWAKWNYSSNENNTLLRFNVGHCLCAYRGNANHRWQRAHHTKEPFNATWLQCVRNFHFLSSMTTAKWRLPAVDHRQMVIQINQDCNCNTKNSYYNCGINLKAKAILIQWGLKRTHS